MSDPYASRDRIEANLADLRHLNFMLSLGAQQFVHDAKPLHLHLGPEDQVELARERAYMQRCPMPDAPASDR